MAKSPPAETQPQHSNLPAQLGNYKLERKLGRGATSEVWLARHLHLDERAVALKILMTQDADAIVRFKREAQIASQLSHPNIVEVIDHGQYISYDPPGRFYCTMLQYIHGGSLQRLLDKQDRIPLVDALAIFRQLAAALDYAHSLDIIHRDISPGNVLLDQRSGQAFLTDFGIARNLNQPMTIDSSVMGTPGYWSPEHTRSATEVTQLSDIYSLGVVLYVMLSGKLPWKDASALLPANDTTPPALHEQGVTNSPPEMDRVLQTLMASEPARRYPTAQAAVEQIDRVLRRHQVSTRMHNIADPPDSATTTDDLSDLDEVELALGPSLLREPMVKAQERADQLRDAAFVTDLLDKWAAERPLRRSLLGRLARLQQTASYNLYFYELKVLYEQRGLNETTEEPDYHQQVFPLEPELSRWLVPLTPAQEISTEVGGQVVLPGSTRVTACDDCQGRGKLICPRCKGKQRIYEEREIPVPVTEEVRPSTEEPTDSAERPPTNNRLNPARSRISRLVPGQTPEQPGKAVPPRAPDAPPIQTRLEKVLVPCPDCSGTGGIPCIRCDSVGRLVQQQAFRWQRVSYAFSATDDLGIDEQWLLKRCDLHHVYTERVGNGTPRLEANPFRPEWEHIPALATLLEQARAATNDTSKIIFSEVSIRFIPVSELVFDLGGHKQDEPVLYRLAVYGFGNAIPDDWRFLNWERVLSLIAIGCLLILVAVFGFFAFTA